MLALLLGGGCALPVEQAVDRSICSKLDLPVDLEPRTQPDETPSKMTGFTGADSTPPGLQLSAAQKADGKEKGKFFLSERIINKISKEVPGSATTEFEVPGIGAPPEVKAAAIDRQFPALEELGKVLDAPPGPDGRPLTLADLQRLALTNNPVLKQMAFDVEAARGGAVQARLYPNPTIGIAAQAAGPGGGPLSGAYVSQHIKAPGKIALNYTAAYKDVQTAELHLRQAESDLRTMVRAAYFAVLVGRENVKVKRALAVLTDEVYKVMVLNLKGGKAAAYEPLQLRIMANHARIAYVQAHHSYLQLWKQLAATLGVPGMPLTQLAGRLDMPIPKYEWDRVQDIVLSQHTDHFVAKVGLEKAQTELRIAQVTPIPDFIAQLAVQEDNSPGPGPFRTIGLLQFGVVLPVWDRNQGGIRQAQGQLGRANEEPHRVRCDLASRLADAFSRYEQYRKIVALYNSGMLTDQIKAFKAVVRRHDVVGAGEVSFLDLLSAEQNLVSLIQSYIGALHDMWGAVVDVAGLLQTPDLFQVEATYAVAPIPDLEQLFDLPCFHPCSPIHDRNLFKGDRSWPPYGPESEKKQDETAPAPRMQKTHIDLGAPIAEPPANTVPCPDEKVSQSIPDVMPDRGRAILSAANSTR
jgi:cobalt-zinc-cadmium efflux system outer membrane protein